MTQRTERARAVQGRASGSSSSTTTTAATTLIDDIRDKAADPAVAINWFDAAVLTERVREPRGKPARGILTALD